MRSLALALTLVSLAQARPQPKVLKGLPPATQVARQFSHDAGDVRVLILASPT